MESPFRWLRAVGLVTLLSACSGSDNDALAETLEDGGDGAAIDGGREPEDSGPARDRDAGMDAAQVDDGLDASATDSGSDAAPAVDAEADAAQADAGNDAGPARNVVYASFAGMLVRIDPDTAELTEVGLVRNAANTQQTYSELVLTWSGNGDSALMVTSYYQTPTLATLDLCTGLATLGPALSRPSTTNQVFEGLAIRTDGTVYVASGNPGSVTSPISNRLGTLNLATGAVTDLSATTIDAYQDDCDMLFFRDGTLYGVDVATANNTLDLFSLSLTTGAATRSISPTPTYAGTSTVPLRIAYDESRGKAFSWRPSDRNLLAIDMTSGAATAIGQTHAASTYQIGAVDQPSRGFFVAPAPQCDD